MVDFVVSAPTLADIETAAQGIPGLWSPQSTGPGGEIIPAHVNQGGGAPVGWAWQDLPGGVWYVQSGTTTDQFGNTVPNLVPKDSNYHGLLRWNGPLSEMPLPQGVSIVTGSQTVNGITTPTYSITVPLPNGDTVSMQSPVPAGFPLSF